MRAVIKDNKLYCRLCEKELGRTKDYGQVEYNGESYTEFIRYCSDLNCRGTGSYLIDLGVDEVRRFIVDESKLKEIKSMEE